MRQPEPSKYRMLTSLFNPMWLTSLSTGDQVIVQLVCEHARTLEQMIAQHSGSQDEELIEYFSRASAHFRILQLAYEKKLGDDASRFTQYVYPKQLDGVLQLAMRRLHDRAAQLRANPGASPGPMPPLNIPADLKLPPWPDPDHRLHIRGVDNKVSA